MGEMMLKVMQPIILDLEKKAKILGAIEILRDFNSEDEVKRIIMEKYNLVESDAERYLSE